MDLEGIIDLLSLLIPLVKVIVYGAGVISFLYCLSEGHYVRAAVALAALAVIIIKWEY